MADDKFSKRLLTAILSVAAVLILVGLWMLGPSKTKTSQDEHWQLCWEKKPEHIGKTSTRQLCLSARIETRTPSYLVISYSYSEGRGAMEGTSANGMEYNGQWKDSIGWGNFHLRFTSPTSAVGWVDEKGKNPINLWLSPSK